MRGASAVDDMLAGFADVPIQVLVVWEPVLKTDVAAPLTGVLGLIGDRRVIQYWDPDLVVSTDIVRSANEDPARYSLEEPLPPGFIAWDAILVFGASARWDEDLPPPAHYDGPVAGAIDGVKRAIANEMQRETVSPRGP